MIESDLLVISDFFLSPAKRHSVAVEKINAGLINATFKIQDSIGDYHVLQKINRTVFKRPEYLSHNIELVTSFLKKSNYPKSLINLRKTADNTTIVEHPKWGCWRMMDYIKQSTCVHSIQKPWQAVEAAKALGQFHSFLFDFDANALKETIPDFVNFTFRLEQFEHSLTHGINERIHSSEEYITTIKSYYKLIDNYLTLSKELPGRVLHGDPKISNFLFNNVSNDVVALIDWDTIMAGPILYDFGDMVRSFTNTRKEDELTGDDNFDLGLYRAIHDGYLFHLENKLAPLEKENLMLGAKTVTLVQAMRFLTDYLNGDTYYEVSDKEQNRRRAMNQIHLLKNLVSA